jgi:HK97 gp10 family phage protein
MPSLGLARITWKPEAVMDMATAQVTNGMNRAAKFVADDAKRRAHGARTKAAIKYRVRADGRKIEGFVYTTWFVGRFFELGTRKMRARPYLRPAVLENGAEITRLIAKG